MECFEIKGSKDGRFKEGETVIVDDSASPRPGDYVVVERDGCFWCKAWKGAREAVLGTVVAVSRRRKGPH